MDKMWLSSAATFHQPSHGFYIAHPRENARKLWSHESVGFYHGGFAKGILGFNSAGSTTYMNGGFKVWLAVEQGLNLIAVGEVFGQRDIGQHGSQSSVHGVVAGRAVREFSARAVIAKASPAGSNHVPR